MAAVLALGAGAVASHRCAAAIWGLMRPPAGPIEVTVPGDGGRRKRRGITTHRSPTLTAGLVTRRNGLPITKPARTLRDLHRTLPESTYRRAVRWALDLRLISAADLEREEEFTRSRLERLMLELCRRHRLQAPEVNTRVDRFEVDFLWRNERVIVETDSWRHHGHRAAFESDRARDARLQALGYLVLRFTYRQVRDSSAEVARVMRSVLAREG